MRKGNGLYAIRQLYTCSEQVMRGVTSLCALKTSYARGNQFMRAQDQLCAVKSIYPRSTLSTQTFHLLRYLLKDSSKIRSYTFDRIFAILEDK